MTWQSTQQDKAQGKNEPQRSQQDEIPPISSGRTTRQSARQMKNKPAEQAPAPEDTPAKPHAPNPTIAPAIQTLPSPFTARDFPKALLGLLTKKKTWLATHTPSFPIPHTPALQTVLSSTLIFVQEEAGTAVCISPAGLLLTCAHCVAETPTELDLSQPLWLLFSSGLAVRAHCISWDAKRDLALLRITAAQSSTPTFPYTPLPQGPPRLHAHLICVGQPGGEDLESALPGAKTGYDVVHVSTGRFRGYAAGQDKQDNAEIGALKHNCWTYWGHSGAPLVEVEKGNLVGLHSSWDDQTGMRRGIGIEAIVAFIDEAIGLANLV
ncbi:trypsin-like serine protease [Trichodelitschia bisporula]|uniref:Trypsin-like serine protease n=1 Tax=Trichodelitschia bisporula TaxID=703511 RepID=A0A6G1HJV8_9PEZI|nr:trypsin-like serine protease [Trichodelitschia bisporula]